MSEITIREAARLAKLALSPQDEARLAADVALLLQYADALQAVGAADSPMPSQNAAFRPDIPAPSMPRDGLLQAAVRTEGPFIAVPPAIEQGGA